MRRLSILELILGTLGLLAIFGGFRLNNPLLLSVGFLLFGLTFVIGGIDAILTRELRFSAGEGQRRHTQIHRGIPAVLYGLTSLIAGAWVAAFGAAGMLGQGDALLGYVLRHPGPVLISIGAALMCSGAAMMIGSRESRRKTSDFLMSLPGRFGGLILAVFGAAALLGGLFEIVAPEGFDALLASTFGELVPPSMR